MLHRYVAMVSRTDDSNQFAAAVREAEPYFRDWASALSTELACAWVRTEAPSQLAYRSIGLSGCIIGLTPGTRTSSLQILLEPEDHLAETGLARDWGAYVMLRVNSEERTVRVARDPTGRIECWRLPIEGAEVVFSHYDDIAPLRGASPTIGWDYIAFHLFHNRSRGAETGLVELQEVLPGEELTYTPSGLARRMAWRPHELAKNRFADLDEAIYATRAAAEAAVKSWASRYDVIALDLSGGLDSAIVLGLLRQVAGHPNVVGINYLTAHAEGDERIYARAAAAQHGVELIEQQIQPGRIHMAMAPARRQMRPDIRLMPLGYDEVGINIGTRISAQAFFTGTGGDHLFFDHLRVNAVCDYRRHNGFSMGLVKTAHHLARISKDTVWNAFAAAATDLFRSPPSFRALLQVDNPYVANGLADAVDYDRFAHPWVKEALASAPPAKLIQILNLAELQRHYWRFGRADVTEEVHPLFSQPLMEACLRTPAYWFSAGTRQRGLARKAFGDLLPEAIRDRRSKSANTSHWIGILRDNLPTIRMLLLEGQLASRGFLNRPKVEAALNDLSLAAIKNQAGLITCLTTEMWLEYEAPRFRA